MKIETRSIDSLLPDSRNARKHGKRNLATIRASLEQFGQQRAAVIRSDGTVLAGNGMLEAARELGWTELAVTVVPDEWSDEQARAYALADNRTGELAEWDVAVLDEHLVELEVAGLDIEALGFEPPKQHSDVVEDEAPELSANPIVKAGQIWQLGQHRLVCGDASDKQIARAAMQSLNPTLLVTDPPYGIGYEYNSHDDSDNESNSALVASVFAHGPDAKVWTPGLPNLARDISRFGRCKVIVWNKKFAAAGNGLGGASVWEPVLVAGKPSRTKLNVDVLEIPTDRETVDGKSLRELHSCPKPVALYAALIGAFTNRDEAIYEPFCGSGTTLIAAEQTGRRCAAVEIDPAYADVIIRRWEILTGEKAVRVDG
jgi:hypothetical protein